jgi:hypothetical protein
VNYKRGIKVCSSGFSLELEYEHENEGFVFYHGLFAGRRFLPGDGRVIIDYTDDQPERYGKPYAGGKIGFRQMQWTRARYRNFRVLKF